MALPQLGNDRAHANENLVALKCADEPLVAGDRGERGLGSTRLGGHAVERVAHGTVVRQAGERVGCRAHLCNR